MGEEKSRSMLKSEDRAKGSAGERAGHWIARHHKLIFVVATLLLIPAVIGYRALHINYTLMTYLPQNLNSTKGQSILDKDFHNAATAMVIVENPDPKEMTQIKGTLSGIPGVSQVLWRDDIADISVPKESFPDEIHQLFYRKNSSLMVVQFKDLASSDETQEAIAAIRQDLKGKDAYVSGVSAIVKDTKDLIDHETPIYVGIAVLLSFLILVMTNSSMFIPMFFLLNVGYAIVYNMGTNLLLGEISYLTKAIAAVLQLAVSMDYSIFLYHRYEEERSVCATHVDAMGNAIHKTLRSIFGSSLTTIAGFLALIVMQLTLGRDIGLVMAKGVLFSLLAVLTILPAMLLMADKLIHRYRHRVLLPQFRALSRNVTKHAWIYCALFFLLAVPAVYGSTHTAVYYNLDRSLPSTLPGVVATDKLRSDYNMATTHFVLFNKSAGTAAAARFVKEVKTLPGIESVQSMDTLTGGEIPKNFLPKKLNDLFSKGNYNLVMINSAYKAASPEVSEQIGKITTLLRKADPHAYLTGEAPLTLDLTRTADHDFRAVNLVSILVVCLIIFLLYRSLWLPMVLVLAIELAIQINMGLPFYMGMTIPFVASIIIGTIQLGSTIDYSILLSTRFFEELNNEARKLAPHELAVCEKHGRWRRWLPKESCHAAMQRAVETSARSIVTSALAFMAATVGVGFYSQMDIVRTICRMMARGSFISMLVTLLILPSLLLVTYPVLENTSLDLIKMKKNGHIRYVTHKNNEARGVCVAEETII